MDQREFPRVMLRSEATIRQGERNITGMLANLSLNGVYIRTDTRIPVGVNTEVSFSDTLSDKIAEVKISGNVVRSDEEGIAFKLHQLDVDSFINLHLIVAKQAAHI